jgi:DNA (cytosine-5)-methyltransferase 1
MVELYSSIKEKLNIRVDKQAENEGLAFLTHFWHNQKNGVSQYYKPSAEAYLVETLEEPEQLYIPLKFDVPFPPTERPKFKFIDLFAGIGGIRLAYQKQGGKCVFSSE